MLKWFQKLCPAPEPLHFCAQCGHAYKPRTGRFADLCAEHAAPHLEVLRKQELVASYAQRHWAELYPAALKEEEACRVKWGTSLGMRQAAMMQAAYRQGTEEQP